MRCVFIINTPYHVINAIEARHSLQSPEDECILVSFQETEETRTKQQVANLVAQSHWNRFEHVRLEPELRSRRSSRRKVEKLFNTIGPIDRLYFAPHYFYAGVHVANRYRPKEIYILDDGADNQKSYEVRFGGWFQSPLERALKRIGKKVLWGLDGDPIEKLTYFSIYDLKMHPVDTLIRHDFKYLRARLKDYARDETVLFVGACIVDLGIVAKADYFRWLRTIRDYFPGRKIIYIPHRLEEPAGLREIEAEVGFEIRPLDVPMEIYLLGSPTLPAILSGFYSTAFDSCYILLKDQPVPFVSFRPPPESFLIEHRRKHVDLIYDYFQKHYLDRMTIVPLT